MILKDVMSSSKQCWTQKTLNETNSEEGLMTINFLLLA